VAGFLAAKPADIADRCPMFEETGNIKAAYTVSAASLSRVLLVFYRPAGRCKYGLVCRFGSSHIKDNKNVINEEARTSPSPPATHTAHAPHMHRTHNTWPTGV
jgi:hypothetical protein